MASLGRLANILKKVIEPMSKEYVADVDKVATSATARSIDEIKSKLPEGFAVEATKEINAQFSKMVNNELAKTSYNDFVANWRTYDKESLSQVARGLNMDMRDVDGLLNMGKVSDARTMIQDHYLEKANNNVWEISKLKAQGFILDDDIAKLEMADLPIETKIKQLEGYTQKAISDHRVAGGFNEAEESGSVWSNLFDDLEGKVSRITETSRKMGTSGVSDLMKNLFNLNDSMDATAKYSRDLFTGLANDMKRLPEDRQIAIRKYVENVEKFNPADMMGKDESMFANKNDAIWHIPQLSKELNLSNEEQRIANKAMNVWYTVAKKQADMDRGFYNVDDFMPYIQMEERSVLRPVTPDGTWARVSEKDLGISYWHAEASKEHLAKVLAKNNELVSILDDVDKKNSYFMAARRAEKEGKPSALRLNEDNNRLLPHEELSAYANQYIYHNIKKRGLTLIDNAINMAAIPIGTTEKNAKGIAKQLYDLKDSWNTKFQRYQPDLSTTKPTIQQWGEKYAEAMADFSVTWALSSPKLFVQGNLLQSVLVGGATKGFTNEFIETGRAMGGFIKTVLTEPSLLARMGKDYHGGINEIIEKMYKGSFDNAPAGSWESYASSGFRKLMQRSPELAPSFDQQLESSFLNPKIKSLLDLAKLPFQVADRMSRFGGYAAAVKHAYPHLKTYQKNLIEDMEPAKAMGILEKELHMKAFRSIRREHIRQFLSVNKNEKMLRANEEEFLHAYADASVKMENFDYTKAGTSKYQDWVRKQNPAVAKAFTFTSFPIYYTRFLMQLGKAYAAGDTKPLLKLAAAGVTLTAGSYAMAEPDKEKRKLYNEWGSYAVNVAPIISLYGVPTRLLSSPLGIMESAFSMPFSLAMKGTDWTFHTLSGHEDSGKIENGIDSVNMMLERSNMKHPMYRWANHNYKIIKEELGR